MLVWIISGCYLLSSCMPMIFRIGHLPTCSLPFPMHILLHVLVWVIWYLVSLICPAPGFLLGDPPDFHVSLHAASLFVYVSLILFCCQNIWMLASMLRGLILSTPLTCMLASMPHCLLLSFSEIFLRCVGMDNLWFLLVSLLYALNIRDWSFAQL